MTVQELIAAGLLLTVFGLGMYQVIDDISHDHVCINNAIYVSDSCEHVYCAMAPDEMMGPSEETLEIYCQPKYRGCLINDWKCDQ